MFHQIILQAEVMDDLRHGRIGWISQVEVRLGFVPEQLVVKSEEWLLMSFLDVLAVLVYDAMGRYRSAC